MSAETPPMADAPSPKTLLECKTAFHGSLLCEGRSDEAWENRQQELAALWAIAAGLYLNVSQIAETGDALGGIESAITDHE
jgi:hypothetical protein